jgi:hypothetical protein
MLSSLLGQTGGGTQVPATTSGDVAAFVLRAAEDHDFRRLVESDPRQAMAMYEIEPPPDLPDVITLPRQEELERIAIRLSDADSPDSPLARSFMGLPQSKSFLGLPQSKSFMGLPQSKSFLGLPQSKSFMGLPQSKSFIGLPQSKSFLGFPQSSRDIAGADVAETAAASR